MSDVASGSITIESGKPVFTSTHAEFLAVVGQRVRDHRDSVHMSRKVLSQRSDVSERYLAQLESGKGNMSIKLLRKVSIALDVPLDKLVV
jgi:XRE family aerobic/anaerobic benzoate catabolism transcriptional regulator